MQSHEGFKTDTARSHEKIMLHMYNYATQVRHVMTTNLQLKLNVIKYTEVQNSVTEILASRDHYKVTSSQATLNT